MWPYLAILTTISYQTVAELKVDLKESPEGRKELHAIAVAMHRFLAHASAGAGGAGGDGDGDVHGHGHGHGHRWPLCLEFEAVHQFRHRVLLARPMPAHPATKTLQRLVGRVNVGHGHCQVGVREAW